MSYVYYDRMRGLVDVIPAHDTIEVNSVITYIKTHKLSAFIVSPPRTTPAKFLSDRSIRRIISHMKELNFLVVTKRNYIDFNPVERYPKTDAEFNKLLAKLVKNYLNRHGAGLTVIKDVIKKIKRPKFPDSITIHAQIYKKPKGTGKGKAKTKKSPYISKERFNILLNLLAEINIIQVHSSRIFYFLR